MARPPKRAKETPPNPQIIYYKKQLKATPPYTYVSPPLSEATVALKGGGCGFHLFSNFVTKLVKKVDFWLHL
jgi:hypothetical protein